MPSYLLDLDLFGFYTADMPGFEIWTDGSLDSSYSISSTGTSISLSVSYGGTLPSSLEFRFNDASGEMGRSIQIRSVRINGRDVDEGNYLSADTLTSGATATVDVPGADFIFDQSEPDPSLFTVGATRTFTAGNDRLSIYNSTADEVFDALDGRDIIYLGSGNDTVNGNGGRDLIHGRDGDDFLYGGADDDRLYGDDGNDTIYGGTGRDRLQGGNGNDELHGGDGNDRVSGNDGDDILTGGDGNDRLGGGDGADQIFGDAGSDQIIGGNGNDTLDGGADNDVVYGGAGDDYIHGGLGDDTLIGQLGADTIYGNEGVDTILGQQGADIIFGGAGNDEIYGGTENDTIYGGSDDDEIFGGDDSDDLFGESGADDIFGGDGNDTIDGGAGNDEIHGGDGADIINGGIGNDEIYGDSNTPINVLEAGSLTVTQTSSAQWHTVTLSSPLLNPVIKMFAEDMNDDPFTLRVRNVTNTSFQFQLDEYDYLDGITGAEDVSWIALSEGSHQLSNGTTIEAGNTSTSNETFASVSFASSFSNAPVVFSQLSSDNDASAAVTRNRNVTSAGFQTHMHEQELGAGAHAAEDIGWIAVEAGGSAASGFLAGTTGDNVTHATSTVNFGGVFGAAPIFVADSQTNDGGDPGTAAGLNNLTTSSADIAFIEEASADAEINHTTENIGYVALNSGSYTALSTDTGSDVIRGGDGDDIIYSDGVVDSQVQSAGLSNPVATSILSDNPVAYWALNETSGTNIINYGTQGSAIDGTRIGGAGLLAGDLYTNDDNSISFDGVNDGILIPDSAFINTGTYTAKTVELTFNADDVTSRQVLYEEGGGTHGFSIYLFNNRVYVTGEHDGVWVDADISSAISTGTTYHVAFVFDSVANSFTGYLDGVDMDGGTTVTVGGATFPAHSGDIGIGYSPDSWQTHDGELGSGFHFDGRISDVAIYTDALTQTQIQDHVDAANGIAPPTIAIDDTLYGGDGMDQFFAGEGRDVFIFEAANAFNDVDEINAFDIGEQDALDVSELLTGFVDGVSDINDFVNVTTSGADALVGIDANGLTGGASFTDIVRIIDGAGLSADSLLANNGIIPV